MLLERGGLVAHPSECWRYVWARAWARGGIDRGLLNGGGGSGGSPFTCPRGSMAAHAAASLLSPPAPTATRPPHPLPEAPTRLLPRDIFQIIRLQNRLAVIQFAVLKAIKLGECAPSQPRTAYC